MGAHVFDQAIALTAAGDGQYTGATSPAYANMVGPFGGVTAATALNAVMLHPALLGEPLSLTVNFCAALADGPFAVSAQPVRTNRSTQHWVVAVTQTGAFGRGRNGGHGIGGHRRAPHHLERGRRAHAGGAGAWRSRAICRAFPGGMDPALRDAAHRRRDPPRLGRQRQPQPVALVDA